MSKKQKGYFAPDLSALVFILLAFSVFGVWKIIEVTGWLWNHISII